MASRKRIIKAVSDRLLREVEDLEPGQLLRLCEAYAKLAGQGSAVSADADNDRRILRVCMSADLDELSE